MELMIYRRRRLRSSIPGGFYRFEGPQNQNIYGFAEGDFVRLRDEYGNIWRGMVERQADGTVRFRFRDEKGRCIAGISDCGGILLRDEKGNTWRGFID